MNSKYSNLDLINATLEIYNEFKPSQSEEKTKKDEKDIIQKPEPLLLSKEVKKKNKQFKKLEKKQNQKKNPHFNSKSPKNKKISNSQRLATYQKRRGEYKFAAVLRLTKIIKFENEKYLLLHKLKNSDLKIIKMKRPNL